MVGEFNIEVTTRLLDSEEDCLFNDVMAFNAVGEATRSFFADSCKAAVVELMRTSRVRDDQGFILQFRTVVRDTTTNMLISDSGVKTVTDLDQAGVEQFERFAIVELAEARAVINAERQGVVRTTTRRNVLKDLLGLIFKGTT